jgi:hypothetical protein
MPILVPKIVWPSGGANELLFAFPPVNVRPFDQAFRRHDTIASSGERQSLLERVDKFLELDLTLVPTEAENYLTRSEELDHGDWTKSQVTVEANTSDVTDPLDGNTADKVIPDVSSTNARIWQDRQPPEIVGRSFATSIWLRVLTGSMTVRMVMHKNASGGSDPQFQGDAIVVDSWKRFFLTGLGASDWTHVGFQIGGSSSWEEADGPIYFWGGQLAYGALGPYVKTQAVIPAAIDRWDTFITAVLDGTNFDYYPDAFAAGKTTYVLEDKRWRPKLQVRGANRFYEFKLRLREFV